MSGEHKLAFDNKDTEYVWYFEKLDELVISKVDGYLFKDKRGSFMSVWIYKNEIQSPHLRLDYVGEFE